MTEGMNRHEKRSMFFYGHFIHCTPIFSVLSLWVTLWGRPYTGLATVLDAAVLNLFLQWGQRIMEFLFYLVVWMENKMLKLNYEPLTPLLKIREPLSSRPPLKKEPLLKYDESDQPVDDLVIVFIFETGVSYVMLFAMNDLIVARQSPFIYKVQGVGAHQQRYLTGCCPLQDSQRQTRSSVKAVHHSDVWSSSCWLTKQCVAQQVACDWKFASSNPVVGRLISLLCPGAKPLTANASGLTFLSQMYVALNKSAG